MSAEMTTETTTQATSTTTPTTQANPTTTSTTQAISTTTSTATTPTTPITTTSTEHGVDQATIIIAAVVPAVVVVIIILVVAGIIIRNKRRRRERPTPQPLPVLDPFGRVQTADPVSHRHRPDPHDDSTNNNTSSKVNLLPPKPKRKEPAVGANPDANQQKVRVIREKPQKHSAYMNSNSSDSSTGMYVEPPDDVPDNPPQKSKSPTLPKSQAVPTQPRGRPTPGQLEEPQGTFESHYMEMDPMKNRDSELAEAGKASIGSTWQPEHADDIYLPPDSNFLPAPPAPCLPASPGYVNLIPEDEGKSEDQGTSDSFGEVYQNVDDHQYRNVQPDMIHGDLSLSARSFPNLVSAEEVKKTMAMLPPAVAGGKTAAAKTPGAGSAKGRGVTAASPRPRQDQPRGPGPAPTPTPTSRPSSSSSDSDDDPQLSYENVPEGTGPHGHSYVNAPDRKTEPAKETPNRTAAADSCPAVAKKESRQQLNNGTSLPLSPAQKSKKAGQNPQGLAPAAVTEELARKLAKQKKKAS